jgi:hypothetical protein
MSNSIQTPSANNCILRGLAPRSDLKRLEVELRGVSIPRSLGKEIPSPQVNHERFTASGHFDQ